MKKRILIIEDKIAAAFPLQELLKENGYSTDLAVSGREALLKFSRKSYDLMLTDYRLPDMDGVELMKEFRTRSPEINVVFLTGYDALLRREKIKTGPKCQIVEKSVNPGKILQTIKAMLG